MAIVNRKMMVSEKRQEYAIFGGKGGGEVIADYLNYGPSTATVLGFLNDQVPVGQSVGDHTVLGGFESWKSQPQHIVFNAPLHKAKLMLSRAMLINRLGVPDGRWGMPMHPLSLISPTATVGPGSSVGPFCNLQPAVRIGRHVAIRSGACIGHDVTISDFSFVAVNAVISGYTHIGEGAHIGPNATIKEDLKIGRYCVIGMGSTVTNDVEDFAIMAGSPARKIGTIDPTEVTH